MILEDYQVQVLQKLDTINQSIVEGFWLVSLVVAIGIGFKIFYDNLSKW